MDFNTYGMPMHTYLVEKTGNFMFMLCPMFVNRYQLAFWVGGVTKEYTDETQRAYRYKAIGVSRIFDDYESARDWQLELVDRHFAVYQPPFSVWVDEGQRENSRCACGGFNSAIEAYEWAEAEGLTGRIGFDIRCSEGKSVDMYAQFHPQ